MTSRPRNVAELALFEQTSIERFWSKVNKTSSPTGCWLWTGAKTKYGYGNFGTQRRVSGVIYNGTISAHRYSYLLARGSIPQGKMICHTCDVKLCANPEHLYAGTHADNMRDMAVRHRAHSKRRFTAEEETALLNEYVPYIIGYPVLATKYHVCPETIKRALIRAGYHPGARTR